MRKHYEGILQSLRWEADMMVTNPFDEVVWLKPLFDSNKKRIGITDCCFVDSPCERHQASLSVATGGTE